MRDVHRNCSFRPIPGLSREEEEKQLAEIIDVAQENLVRTQERIGELTDELYDLMETYGPKDKEALALLHNTQSQLREGRRDLLRCQKARKKPYFGRIDFKDPALPQAESYYVGRVGISKGGAQPVVIDWRAPVASVYYENALGPCKYVVKNEGTYQIDLMRKRTYEIEADRLKDFFDSDVVANDELLTKYLAKSKKAVLGEIIATIQKEQNAIIRKSPKTNLIVQGVAGSGKTTVAMHRISYILYNYEEEFRPEDFYIIGSNRILLNYITSVLPDLDVYGVSQMTMEQLFVRLLYEDWDPKIHHIHPASRKDIHACRKGSYEWFHDLERFCSEYEKRMIPAAEVRPEKNGVLLLDEEAIRAYLENNPQMSMQAKVNMLNEMLLSKLENELAGKYVSYTPAEKKELKRLYRWHFGKDVWKGSVFEVYREFLQAQKQRGKGIPFTENMFDIYDLAALAYLYKRIKETDGIREASHVIIDEAQDFGMMAYGALSYCLRGCTYTIMGDVSQNIHFEYGLNDWNDLQDLILTGTFDSFELLKKSYRNTVEISAFATEILRHGNFPIYPVDPVRRHGNEVQVTQCGSEAAMLRETEKAVRKWQRQGHETIAVICRDAAESAAVSSALGKSLALADSNPETTAFGNGVMVLPVEYTKGLEFDAVLIYHPSAVKYPAEDAYVKLLYVAATRALHELMIVHQGDLTELIGKPVSEEKRMRSLENEVRKKVRRFEAEETTAREQELLDVRQGDKERAMRGYIGPKAIVAQPASVAQLAAMSQPAAVAQPAMAKKDADTGKLSDGSRTPETAAVMKKSGQKRGKTAAAGAAVRDTGIVNMSRQHFGDVPDGSVLRPKGHSRIDCGIRMAKKTKKYIDLISSYGLLRLTPMEEGIIRIQFRRDRLAEFEPGPWDAVARNAEGEDMAARNAKGKDAVARNAEGKDAAAWTAKEGRNLLEIATGRILVRIEKKTGALQFFDREGGLLLAEKAALPRQMETAGNPQSWIYFDWPKSEKLSAKGVLADQFERLNQKARYISFGGRKLRMPLVVSDKGYGIGVAAKGTVMCCTIPMYGPYLYTEGETQIDYFFLYGGNYEKTLELYSRL